MRLAISEDGKELGEPMIIPTPQSFEDGIKELADTAFTLSRNQKFTAAAGGIREVLNKEKSMLINEPISSKIPDWVGKPIAQRLREVLKAPVCLENDSALIALGEATHGAGVGKNIVVYLTISTGVGGARIVNSKIDKNCLGFEPGFQIIDYKNNTYLEDVISGPALEKRFGQKPYQVTDSEKWDEVAKILAVGINNTIVHWSPEIVVLGGGVMESIPIERVKFYLKGIVRKFPNLPILVRASLNDKGGLYGALEYLKQVPPLT